MTQTTRRNLMIAAAAGAATGLATPLRSARAQTSAWPSKPIRIIVGFAPGGLTDAYARMFAEQITARYNQPVVVENRLGAGGNIAIDAVCKSPADGYTLLATTTGAVWQNRVLYNKLPFDLSKDLTPVTVFPSGSLLLAVPERVPARTTMELIEYARKNPSIMGSYAPASYPHMLAENFNKLYGTKIESVHYKGEGPMWVEMGSGQQEMAVGSYQAYATVQGKGVRAIAATGLVRCPKFPNLPTLVEQGIKGEICRLDGGLAITAPAATPVDILEKLSKVAVDGNDTPRAKQLRETFAIPDATKGREDALRMWREVAPIWIAEATAVGVKLD
jgi:tripartite-type tricarboxylate transporter receptor subunit TctC